MREILFRGKRTDNGEWVVGYYGQFHNRPAKNEPNSHQIFEPKEEAYLFNSCIGGLWRVISPETLGQYTGVKDCFGKKIFEGDIIETSGNGGHAISVIRYGEFEPKLFYDLIEAYVSRSNTRPTDEIYGLYAETLKGEQMLMTNASNVIKIIGNIHDNPELLKGGC